MPQLNPAPWFMILVSSWAILLTLLAPKILAYIYPNDPTLQSAGQLMKQNWTWPWF